MKSSWSQVTALQLIQSVCTTMSREARQHGRWNTPLLQAVGALAVLAPSPTAVEVVASLLREAPDSAYSVGVITNISDNSRFVHREISSRADAESRFPRYPAKELPRRVEHASALHISAARVGDIVGALSGAKSDAALEEVAATIAVFADARMCWEFVHRGEFPHARRAGPVVVACIESHRRGDTAAAQWLLSELMDNRLLDEWGLLALAAGLLGREPWGGYPFPDY